MPILFDRSVCCDLNETAAREWLVTNGKGGYAAGTVAGMLTRLQQGLLVASPQEGTHPQVLVAKIDEEIVFDQRTYYLGTNEYRDGTLNPAGFVHLETFRLEEGFPVFTYHLGGIDGMVLEKRIWMEAGLDTTYIQYRLLRTSSVSPEERPWNARAGRSSYSRMHDALRTLTLTLLPFAGYRASGEVQHGKLDWQFQVETRQFESEVSVAGCTILAHEGARPYHIFGVGHAESESTFLPTGVWYWHILHRADQAAGRAHTSDLYLPGVFRTKLWPGEDVSFTMILTAEDLSRLTFNTKSLARAYDEAVEEQRNILHTRRYFGEGGATAHTHAVLPLASEGMERDEGSGRDQSRPYSDEEFLRLLMQAANRLVAERAAVPGEGVSGYKLFLPERKKTPFVVSGYYDGGEQTRDTLIALPGLLLATERYAEARQILSRLGSAFHQGLLPDRLPPAHIHGNDEVERGHEVEKRHEAPRSSADTALWFFYALDEYVQATGDYELLESLASVLAECIECYRRGTLHGIGVDARDGLIGSHARGLALTWMNATTGEAGGGHRPVTPRTGKAVEVNALWYHALSLMMEWAGRFPSRFGNAEKYEELRQHCRRSFNERFWYASGGYLYDVIDGDEGDDSSIRPNQLFALSLRHGVLDRAHRSSVLHVVTSHLLVPYGLRTLSPQDERYRGRIAQDEREQRSSLHQGGAWSWLIGPYVDALLRVEGQIPEKRKQAIKENQHARESREIGWKGKVDGQESERENVWHRGIRLLESFREQLRFDMLGAIGSVYDGDTPYAPRNPHGYLASALSTGEIVRVYHLLAHMGVRFTRQTISV